jgi:hypothetical protein
MEQILDGRQPARLQLGHICDGKLPLDWAQQRALFAELQRKIPSRDTSIEANLPRRRRDIRQNPTRQSRAEKSGCYPAIASKKRRSESTVFGAQYARSAVFTGFPAPAKPHYGFAWE